MEDFIYALHAATYRNVSEFHLSPLAGLPKIPAKERDSGNVFQATVRGPVEVAVRFPLIHWREGTLSRRGKLGPRGLHRYAR